MLAGVPISFLVFAVAVSYLGFIVSSTAGIGGALLLTPVLMMRLPAAEAIGLASTVLIANNGFKTLVFKRFIDKRAALIAASTALPLAVLGAMLTSRVDERILRAAIGVLVLASLGVELWLRRPIPVRRAAFPVMTGTVGFVSGLCSMAGPVAAITFKGYGLAKEQFVSTVAIVALGMQLVKLPAYMATGVLHVHEWPLVVLFSAVALAGVLTGRRIVGRLDVRRFHQVLNVFLVVIAVMLLYQAARG